MCPNNFLTPVLEAMNIENFGILHFQDNILGGFWGFDGVRNTPSRYSNMLKLVAVAQWVLESLTNDLRTDNAFSTTFAHQICTYMKIFKKFKGQNGRYWGHEVA